MPKMRGFKPEIWTDEKFIELRPLARLLFMGMWNYACDNGHVEDKPKQIKMRILPADDCDIDELLTEIENQGMIHRNRGVITIPNLTHHQRLDRRYFTTCEHCVPDGHTTGTRSEPTVSPTGSRVEGRKEGNEGEMKERAHARETRATKLPTTWKPNQTHLERALAANLDLGREADKFRAHAAEKGRTVKNWNAAFTRWLMNAEDYARADQRDQPKRHPERFLPLPHQLEEPPDGLSPTEYRDWHAAMRKRQRGQAS